MGSTVKQTADVVLSRDATTHFPQFYRLPVESQTRIIVEAALAQLGGLLPVNGHLPLPDALQALDPQSYLFEYAYSRYQKIVAVLDCSTIETFKVLKLKDRKHLQHLVFNIRSNASKFVLKNHAITGINEFSSLTVWVDPSLPPGHSKFDAGEPCTWRGHNWVDDFLRGVLISMARVVVVSQTKKCRFVLHIKQGFEQDFAFDHMEKNIVTPLQGGDHALVVISKRQLADGWYTWAWKQAN